MTAPLRIMVVDDEAPARARLRNLLDDIAERVPTVVVAEAGDGIEALEVSAGLTVDIALIDIRMPRMDGLELARQLATLPSPPGVIFATAFDQYAVKAFELSAVDYLLKPVRAERLAEALTKAVNVAKVAATAALASAIEAIEPGGRRQLRCLERGKVLLVPIADVLYFKAELKYVTARTREREFLLEESLSQLEHEFSRRFMRIHRNCLVARDAIAGYEREHEASAEAEPRWALILHGVSERLPVSRRLWPQVKSVIGQ